MKSYHFKMVLLLMVGLCPGLIKAQLNHAVDFSINKLIINNEIAQDGKTYAKLYYPGLEKIEELGKPDLPVKYIKLIVPFGKEIDQILINSVQRSEVLLSNKVYPVQNPEPTCLDCGKLSFVDPDQTIYDSDKYWPKNAIKFNRQGCFDGNNNIITLAICPFEYSPEEDVLNLFTSIKFTLVFKNSTADDIITVNRKAKNQKMIDGCLNALVDNPESIINFKGDVIITDEIASESVLPAYDYVVVTHSSFVDGFNDFIEWKSKKRYKYWCCYNRRN